jgi:hypothetical protein
MKTLLRLGIVAFVLFVSANGYAQMEFFDEFEENYDLLMTSLDRKPPAELAEISNFVYEKDRATFTLDSGRIYFLRYVLDRPTTAIFIGHGHARMTVPMQTERQSLLYASGATDVDETFEVAFIRFADNFDLKLKERFTFEVTTLPWRDFNFATQAQGEFFFEPKVFHEYDHLFQLLRSVYERAEDGYFWIDFNRYVFSFDPNRPHEVHMSYEHEGGDQEITEGAVLQRQERGIDDDAELSDVLFPTTMISRQAWFRMKGLDGKVIDQADARVQMVINVDSLRFISLFLPYNLDVDSIYHNNAPIAFHRRGDFTFMGLILSTYVYQGDTLDLRLWYHGKDYGSLLPFVEDMTPTPLKLTFNVPASYNYLMPAKGERREVAGGRVEFDVIPDQPYHNFQFQPLATGFDTVTFMADAGINFNIIQSSAITKSDFQCFIPDEVYQPTVLKAFNFMTGRLGIPPATFEMFVFPDSTLSMPGLMEVPQVQCLIKEEGGLDMSAGKQAARQYFGNLARPATDREFWILDGTSDYMSLLNVEQSLGAGVYFGELGRRRNHVYTEVENDDDVPLAAGNRVNPHLRTAKASWVMHMLHYLMYDLENPSDRPFLKFVRELSILVNGRLYKNTDFIELAEKHYGDSLNWFFDHWLYDRNIPEYDVAYAVAEREGQTYLDVTVNVKAVSEDFTFPVIMRVTHDNGSSTYHRKFIPAASSTFSLGPFESKPQDLIFNEFYSVLAKQNVDRK